MITANELRIENWVYDNLKKRQVEVLGIEPSWAEIWVRFANGYADYKCEIKHVEPITLTSEILEKLGFKKFGNEYNRIITVTHYESINCFVIEHSYGGAKKILYVHQLQNIYYSLTNEELEINL